MNIQTIPNVIDTCIRSLFCSSFVTTTCVISSSSSFCER